MAAKTASRASGKGMRARMRMRTKSLHSTGCGSMAAFAFGALAFGSSLGWRLPRYTYHGGAGFGP